MYIILGIAIVTLCTNCIIDEIDQAKLIGIFLHFLSKIQKSDIDVVSINWSM